MWTAETRQRYAWTRRKEGPRLTDPEWALLERLLPRQASMGRPWRHTLRSILDAILLLLRTGCALEQAFGAERFCRRLLVDHETLPRVSEAMIQLGSIMRFVHTLTA